MSDYTYNQHRDDHHSGHACTEDDWKTCVRDAGLARIAELEAERDRLHSWDGLMELLDEHWPADVWPMLEDDHKADVGHRVTSAMRWIDQLKRALSGHLFDGESLSTREAIRSELIVQSIEAEAERDRARDLAVALEGQVARVQGLHTPGVMYDGTGDQYCTHCHDDPGAYPDQRWPCPTIRALDGVVP